MGRYLLQRCLLALPTLFGVAVITFVLLRVVPGDPIAMMTPPGATVADVERLRERYGLNDSIPQQFISWLAEVCRGNLGTSISLRQNVLELILDRLPSTLELVVSAALAAVVLGGGLALIGVYGQDRWPEAAVDGVTGLGLAVPDFIWGLLFILSLGVLWPLLPVSGRLDPRLTVEFTTRFYLLESLALGRWSQAGMLFSHLLLPAAALALPLAAVITRVLKSTLKEVMTQDFIVLAQVKGLGRRHIILREALRNALIPTVTLTGVQFTFLLGGTVLVERIFSFPGIGNMAIGAVIERDLPLIQGLVLTFAVLFIANNLVVDLTYAWLNPKVRHG